GTQSRVNHIWMSSLDSLIPRANTSWAATNAELPTSPKQTAHSTKLPVSPWSPAVQVQQTPTWHCPPNGNTQPDWRGSATSSHSNTAKKKPSRNLIHTPGSAPEQNALWSSTTQNAPPKLLLKQCLLQVPDAPAP